MFHFTYVHNLSPYLIHAHWFGKTIGVRWYGLVYVLGITAAFFAFRFAARRGYVRGLDEETMQQMMGAIVMGVIGGGRLGFVLQHPQKLWHDPFFLLRVWEGGMAFFGGLVGVILALFWTARRYEVNFWSLADIAAFPAAFGLGIGRIANFINGELWGNPTGGDWGVVFLRVDNLPRHPSQLYEAVSHLLLLGILVWLWRRYPLLRRQHPGVFAWLFLAIYGALRFLTDFYRADDMFYGPFSSGQWASLLVAAIGAIGLTYLRGRPQKPSPLKLTSV